MGSSSLLTSSLFCVFLQLLALKHRLIFSRCTESNLLLSLSYSSASWCYKQSMTPLRLFRRWWLVNYPDQHQVLEQSSELACSFLSMTLNAKSAVRKFESRRHKTFLSILLLAELAQRFEYYLSSSSVKTVDGCTVSNRREFHGLHCESSRSTPAYSNGCSISFLCQTEVTAVVGA